MDGDAVCRGCLTLGNCCGKCHKCKAAAFDWICENMTMLRSWAVMETGQHDVMRAVQLHAKRTWGG